jgi:uncharacterized protein YecE (DUF72 family)
VLRLSRKGTGKALARKVRKIRAGGTRTFVLRPRNKRARAPKRAVLMVRVANQAGQASVLRRTIRIKKR